MNLNNKMRIDKVLRNCGGFVRYYDTTEPLQELAVLIAKGNCRDILACCGGGDQALTMLGAGKGIRALWAVDINPAQLFLLAAKAEFLKKKVTAPFRPAFKQIQQVYPGRIEAVRMDIRSIRNVYHLPTGKRIAAPAEFSKKYASLQDDGMFVLPKAGPFWQQDTEYIARIRSKISSLRFLRSDILESPQYFKPGSLDLIYFSDIYWQGTTSYHQDRMTDIFRLLRPNGRLISFNDPGDDFEGRGISPLQVLAHQGQRSRLKINKEVSGYWIIRRGPKA